MIEWAEFKFPPLNLLNMPPTAERLAIHEAQVDPTLFEDKSNERKEMQGDSSHT